VIDRFFGAKNKQEVVLDTLIDGVKLVNDVKYRRRVDDLKKEIDATTDATGRPR